MKNSIKKGTNKLRFERFKNVAGTIWFLGVKFTYVKHDINEYNTYCKSYSRL